MIMLNQVARSELWFPPISWHTPGRIPGKCEPGIRPHGIPILRGFE